MNNFCRSDTQLLQVGCTALLLGRSDVRFGCLVRALRPLYQIDTEIADMWGLVRLRQFLGRALRLLNMCHLTYYMCVRPTSFASDLLKLSIRPTKVFHLTYKCSASEVCIQHSVKCTTDLG